MVPTKQTTSRQQPPFSQVFRQVFDVAPGPSAHQRIDLAGEREVQAFLEQYRDALSHRGHLSTPHPGLFPYIPARIDWVDSKEGDHYLLGTAETLDVASYSFGLSSQFSSSVKSLLLYCHGVAIDDPLDLDPGLLLMGRGQQMYRSVLHAVNDLSSLIDGRLLFLVPASLRGHDTPQLNVTDDSIRQLAQGLDVHSAMKDTWISARIDAGLEEMLEGLISSPDSDPFIRITAERALTVAKQDRVLRTQLVQHMSERHVPLESWAAQAVEAIRTTLSVSSRYSGLDWYFPWSHYATIFGRLVDMAILPSIPERTPERELLNLHQILRMDLPDLSSIGVTDMIALRRESESFDQWRTALSRGLERSRQNPDDMGSEELELIRQEMAMSVLAMNREIGSSKTLAAARAGLGTFVAGLVPSAAGAILSGASLDIALATSGMTAALAGGRRFLQGRQAAQRSFDRHYALFLRNE